MDNKVSVIMSIYNNEKTIEKAILSILSQSYENIELNVIDDFSNDQSYAICKEIALKHKNINVYQNEINLGLTKSLNILISKSTGQFIARQDGDDYSHVDRIHQQINLIESRNFDVVSTRAYIMDSKKVIPNYSYYLPLKQIIKYKNPFIHGTLLIKKDVLDKIGGYDHRFRYSQDYKLMTDLLNSGYKALMIKEPLYYLNMNNNISNNYKKEQKYYADCVRNNLDPVKI